MYYTYTHDSFRNSNWLYEKSLIKLSIVVDIIIYISQYFLYLGTYYSYTNANALVLCNN